MAEFSRELEQTFVRFRAAITEKDASGCNQSDQRLCEAALQLMVIKIGDMHQFARLKVQGIRNLCMGMAK